MTLFGPDVSSAQRGIDTGILPADFVIVKCTGGTNYANPYFDQQLQAAKRAGKRTAIYHFAHDPGQGEGTAAQEAAWFLQNAAGYLDGTNMVVLDWEGDNITDSQWALTWNNIVRNQSGIQPVGYGSTSQLEYLRPCYNVGMPIWAAGYSLGYQRIDGYNVPQGPFGVPPGMSPVMWQFTSSGYLPGWGSALDLNIFYGDGAAWDALAAKNGTITPQGYTPQEDTLSQAEVQQIQMIDNGNADRVINDTRAQIAALQTHIENTIAAQAYDIKVFDQQAGHDEGSIIIGEVRANAAMLVAIASKDAPGVAAAIPADIAKAVADELAKRLAS